MNRDMFSINSSLRIGRIVEVSGNAIRVELSDDLSELTKSFSGKIYSIGQIGSIIKIPFGRKVLFAIVRMLRMRSEIVAEEGRSIIKNGDDQRMLEADLFGQGVWNSKDSILEFSRGVETYPLPLQDIFLCIDSELECIYKAAERLSESNSSPMVPIGNYVGSNAICRANIDKLFGHHCAVLGSTGSGKSGTVAAIIHSVISHVSDSGSIKPKIIIIDPHGEYAKAFSGKSIVFKAYNEASSSGQEFESLILPYWLMSGDEFRSLVIGKTEFEATSQNNIIYQALTYARLFQANMVENIGKDPQGGARDDVPKNNTTPEDILNFDRDKPTPFSLDEFAKHIDKIQGRKENTQTPLSPTGRDKNDSILKKLKVLRSNPQLRFLMNDYSQAPIALNKVLEQFVGRESEKGLRIVDISGLPNEVAGPLTALISRLLFQYKVWQTRDEREKDPILFVCEEAHRYVPNYGEAQYKEAQEAIRRIAKEGRKYGIGLMLVSQRPSDVEATVLSQCNSWIILRLTNSSDQEHVSKFLPDNLLGLTRMLPSLTRREALFVGEAAALPSRIRINFLKKEQRPDSNDISFVEGWTSGVSDASLIENVSKRWLGLSGNAESIT